MPSRIIREGFITSPRVHALSIGAQAVYLRLMLVADDYGRFPGSVVTIRSACWPLDPEKVRQGDVTKWFNELIRGSDPLIRVFDVHGIPYMELQNFRQQVRSRSKYPNPPWHNNQQLAPENATHDAQQPATGDGYHGAQPIRSRMRIRMQKSYSEEIHDANGVALLTPPADAPPKKKRAGGRHKRSSAELEKALGERLVWFNRCWEIYPRQGRDNKRAGMDSFERRITTHEMASVVYHGIEKYAEKIDADPTKAVKYFEGWITEEKWNDESVAVVPPGKNGTAAEIRRAETISGLEVIAQIRRTN